MPEMKSIRLDDVILTDINVRTDLGDLSDLTASIESIGVQEPVLVRHTKKGGFELFAGFRRFEASRLAGKMDIPAVIHARRSVTNKQMSVLNLTENVQRQDLNPVDEARGFQNLMDTHKMTEDEIVQMVGVKKLRLQKRLDILKMSDAIQEALLQCRITMSAAFDIDRLPLDRQGKFVGVAEELKGERLTKMIDKELDKISAVAGGKKTKEKDPATAMVTELVRSIRSVCQLFCACLNYDEEKMARVKDVNWRIFSDNVDDLKVVVGFFDEVAGLLPGESPEVNAAAEKEIVQIVEGKKFLLDLDRPEVRQGIVQMIMKKAEGVAIDNAKKDGKRPTITYAIAKEAIDTFYTSRTFD